MSSIKIDLITHDNTTDEFVLILVEDGPWPKNDADWKEYLSRIQTRIFDAIDVAVDGHLAMKYPDSKGKKVRVQIDSPHEVSPRVSELVSHIRQHITEQGNPYYSAIKGSKNIKGLCIAMGHERNPFN